MATESVKIADKPKTLIPRTRTVWYNGNPVDVEFNGEDYADVDENIVDILEATGDYDVTVEPET